MKKNLMVVLACFPLLATACPGVATVPMVPSIGPPCANTLDASAFGFTLTIPPDFTCTEVPSNSILLVSARYENASKVIAAVQLLTPVQDCNENGTPDATEIASDPALDANSNGIIDACDGCAGQPICQEQPTISTGNNITFRMFRIVSPNPVFVQYQGSTLLSSGNALAISVTTLSSNDDPALRAILNTILETVELVP